MDQDTAGLDAVPAGEGPARRRTRLAPEVRRALILDATAEIILGSGLSAVTIERVARQAGVSKSLVYAYFLTQDGLLAALLKREQAELRERGLASALKADSFSALIRQTTGLYLEQTRDRGAMISELLAAPAVLALMQDDIRNDQERTFRYFVRAVRREFSLPLPLAIAAVELLSKVTGQAGLLVARRQMDVSEATDLCVDLILGGLSRIDPRNRPGD